MFLDFEVVLQMKSWSFLNGRDIRKWKGITECGKWTNDVGMYAEPVVIFQKSRKCFGGRRAIVYFKMEHKIQGQKYRQLINGIVNDFMSLVDEFSMFLSSADDNICQKFMELGRNISRKRGVEPQTRTEISDMHLVTESGMACCLPSVITAFW